MNGLLYDEEYASWYNAPKQKLARALAHFMGFNVMTRTLGIDFELGLNLGLFHSKPYVQVALSQLRGRNPLVIFAFCLEDIGSYMLLFGKKFQFYTAKCTSCEEDVQRMKDAADRLNKKTMQAFFGPMDDEEGGSMVSAEPKNSPPTNGATLADWP